MIGKKQLPIAGVGDVEISVLTGRAECFLVNGQSQEPIQLTPLRRKHKTAAATLTAECKAIDRVLASQKRRLESSWTSSTSWTWEILQRNWFEHPLVAPLAWRLIWRFGEGESSRDGLWDNGAFRDADGDLLGPIAADSVVRLWHPADSPATVDAWRKRLHKEGIQQPLRQAFREVYLVTTAEQQAGAESARFAGHILKQQQLAALCTASGWSVQRAGPFDSCSHLQRKVQGLRHVITWGGDPVGTETDNVFYRFLRMSTVTFNTPIIKIPRVVFSELMRDVDLFVSVASIGVDPNWISTSTSPELTDYWNAFTSSDLAEAGLLRRRALELILPSLGTAGTFTIEDKHLLVSGKMHTYRIHLQSGAVFQQPSNNHICIVAKPSKETSATELLTGDPMLSMIVSKALLLAKDDKIRDPIILSQLGV